MKNLKHNSIVKIFESLENSKYLMIVMEYINGGDLRSFVRKKKRIDESTAKFIFRQLIEALEYLHSKNIVHRDIKLDNILINNFSVIKVFDFNLHLHIKLKICDFGVSKEITKHEKMTDQCGTPVYMAPEILLNAVKYRMIIIIIGLLWVWRGYMVCRSGFIYNVIRCAAF